MNWAQVFTKRVMCGVNAFFMLLGIAVIIVGALVVARAGDFKSIIDGGFLSIPALLLTLGCFVTILFFLGCYGLHKESHAMMMTFSVILTVILVMEIIGGVAAYVLRNQTDEALDATLSKSFANYAKDNDTKDLWNDVQFKLNCCGVHNYTDYASLNITVRPDSCCIHNTTDLAPLKCNTAIPTNINTNGCEPLIKGILIESLSTVGKVALVVGMLHLLWIVGSCYFAKVFRRQSYESV